nr:hypothetical protein [uncultured Tateyamaria sp.]
MSQRDYWYSFCNSISDLEYCSRIAAIQNRQYYIAFIESFEIQACDDFTRSDTYVMQRRKYLNTHVQELISDLLDNPTLGKIEEWGCNIYSTFSGYDWY